MPKPWADKDAVPFYDPDGERDADTDGDDNGAYEMDPGEGEFKAPNPSPGGNSASRKPGGIA